MIDPQIFMALTTGLLGSGHCLGMCGTLVAALSLCGEGRRVGAIHLLYHAGRLATYAGIGLLAGWLGSAIAFTDLFAGFARGILLASDLFLVLVGLGSARLLPTPALLNPQGAGTAWLSAAVSSLRRLPPLLSALPLGVLFGFLPCGLLYAVALGAAQSASPGLGALVMLAFGVGTLPALLLLGATAQCLGARAQRWLLRGAGLTVALMGIHNLLRHLRMMGSG